VAAATLALFGLPVVSIAQDDEEHLSVPWGSSTYCPLGDQNAGTPRA
jgi:hypothetical protein